MKTEFFQSGPELTNPFFADNLLRSYFKRKLSAEMLLQAQHKLERMGERAVRDLLAASFLLFSLLSLGCTHSSKMAENLPEGLHTQLASRTQDSTRKVEIFWMEPTQNSKPWPVVIYLHGHQDAEIKGGRAFYDWGVLQKASSQGYLAVAVSLPGYGKSSGTMDFGGPDSQQAVAEVIREVRRRPESIDERVALVGISRGASVAAKVGEQVAGLAGLVLISGIYDLAEQYARWKAEKAPEYQKLARAFETQAGFSASGPTELVLRERSVLPEPEIRAPTLIFQGGKDLLTSAAQAELLADKLQKKGVDARAVVYPESAHNIPVIAREKEIDPFLSKVLFR